MMEGRPGPDVRELAADRQNDLTDVAGHFVGQMLDRVYPEHRVGLDLERILAAAAMLFSGERRDRSVIIEARLEGQRAVGAAIRVESPLDASALGVIHTLELPEGHEAPRMARVVLKRLELEGRRRGWLSLRLLTRADHLDPQLSPLPDEWRILQLGVRTRLHGAREPRARADGVRVRRAEEADMAFVAELVGEAMWNALPGFERKRIGRMRVRARGAAFVEELRQKAGACVLVACLPCGRPVGHASADLGVEHEFLRRREAVLFDTFVLTPFRDKGIATLLNAAVESEAHAAGREYLYGTVHGEPADVVRILAELRLQGWRPADLQFVKAVEV